MEIDGVCRKRPFLSGNVSMFLRNRSLNQKRGGNANFRHPLTGGKVDGAFALFLVHGDLVPLSFRSLATNPWVFRDGSMPTMEVSPTIGILGCTSMSTRDNRLLETQGSIWQHGEIFAMPKGTRNRGNGFMIRLCISEKNDTWEPKLSPLHLTGTAKKGLGRTCFHH
jgi:hypothetical protein